MSVPLSDTRLTDQQLASWASRLTEITVGPWLVASDDYGNPVIYVEREGNDGSTTALLLLAGAAATEADVQFMTHSPKRIAALLAEVTRLRAELAAVRACDCYPNPNDHADRCPIFLAAQPASENW